jgi:hypothetical protein
LDCRHGRRGLGRERRGLGSDAGNYWRDLLFRFLFFLYFANRPGRALLAKYFVVFFNVHIVFVLRVIFLFVIEVFFAAVFIIVVP